VKLIREYINEKFKEDSDPISDMNIGISYMIKKWLDHHYIDNYEINDDYTINVYESVKISRKNLKQFPEYINFNQINGDFSIQHNKFISLRGCPKIVKGMFSCSNNELVTLKYCPERCESFYCHSNKKLFTTTEVLMYCNVISHDITVKL